MHTEHVIIWSLTSSALIVSVSIIVAIISWGLTTIGECLPSGFDPSCYSISPNKPVDDVDDPMWWPHEE